MKKSNAPMLGKPLSLHTAEGLWECVKDMYSSPSSNPSTVEDVSISFWKKGKARIMCRREPKYVTESELIQLALDYGKEPPMLRELFESRKIEVRSEQS